MLQKDILECFPNLNLHHIHLWEAGAGDYLLTAHILIPDDMRVSKAEILTGEIRQHLKVKWNISHSTFELEVRGCGIRSLLGEGLNHPLDNENQ